MLSPALALEFINPKVTLIRTRPVVTHHQKNLLLWLWLWLWQLSHQILVANGYQVSVATGCACDLNSSNISARYLFLPVRLLIALNLILSSESTSRVSHFYNSANLSAPSHNL